MVDWSAPLSGKSAIKIGLVILAASPLFLVLGGIGMATYQDYPKEDICHYRHESGGGEFPCSRPYEDALMVFSIGTTLLIVGGIFVVIGWIKKRNE